MINRIISLFLTLSFAVGSFFCTVFPSNTLKVSAVEDTVRYLVDGQSEDGLISYGVVGNINLFEPDEEITVIIDCGMKSLFSTRAGVSVVCDKNDFKKVGYFRFGSDSAQYSFSFSSSLNGIYTVKLKTADNKEYSFKVGIMPKNQIASDTFYYGIQPYVTRAECWDSTYRIPGLDAEKSIDMILDTAEYMGINLIRENGVEWDKMQNKPFAEVNFDTQDRLIGKVNDRGIKYNWILGNGTTDWSLSEKYKNTSEITNIWSYPPNEELWDDYVTKLADHYKENENILWEIWNEPDWEFFRGTREEYFCLLENTARILKKANPSTYVYSGGLAFSDSDAATSYYEKSAELVRKGILDNWAYHNHYSISEYAQRVRETISKANAAGLECGGINSESGVGGADAALIAVKALYTRSTGSDGYVSFSFRKTIDDPSDVSDFAFFNEYLQPSEAVISYSTVISFLGNALFKGNKSESANVVIDEYETEQGTVLACYTFGEKYKMKVPDGAYECCDMYGNPLKLRSKMKITEEPIYIFVKAS